MDTERRGPLTRFARTRPLFLAALMYLFGCALEYAAGFAPGPLFCALAAPLIAAALCFRRGRRFVAPLLIVAMLPLGALRFDAQWQSCAPLPDQRHAALSGRVSEPPYFNAETERCVCVLNEVEVGGAPVNGKLRLYLRGDVARLQGVQLGQNVRCIAHIWPGDPATNPGQFNFSNYLRLRGLRGFATAEIESAELSAPESRPGDLRHRLLGRIAARIDRLFPNNAAVVRAFVLGDRSELTQAERDSYSDSGAAHLLSISGMHVSVLAAAVSTLLGRFLSRSRAFALTLALLILYGALIGLSAALARSMLMFAIGGFAAVFGRYSDPPTRLAAAMLAHLIVRPIDALDSGFILSYGASAGLALLNPPLTRLVHAEKYLRAPVAPGLRNLLLRRLPRRAVGMLIATAAAQIAILPAVVHFFGAQPVWSFAVNLVAVPLSMAAYLISIAGLLTGVAPVAAFADMLFGWLNASVRFFGSLPLATLRIARFPAWLVALCALALLFSSDMSRLPERLRRLLPLVVLPAILTSNLCARLDARGCGILLMDAGQADCAVVRAEGKVYLIDAGDPYTPAADYLRAKNYALEGVFLSHPHADHAGGLASVLEVCTPKRVYVSANWRAHAADEGVEEALSLAVERGAELVYLSAGDEIALSEKTILRVCAPEAGIARNSANDDSLILRVEYGAASALFCGDAPAEIVETVASDADLLKVPHHGGRDALSPALLEKASPSAAVVSVGYNSYGHPAPETIELLEISGARILRTDLCGAIDCRLSLDGALRLRAYRPTEDD